jgi:hypothetical protein
MATDIELAKSTNPIKNGTSITTCSFTGNYNTINTYVNNKPVIEDIEYKYDELFDDITYYVLGN